MEPKALRYVFAMSTSMIMLQGCLGTMDVFRKSGVSENESRSDRIACGATPEGPNRTVVDSKIQVQFEQCMLSKGYSKSQAPAKTNVVLGQKKQETIDDPEYRKSISNNARNVSVDASCKGLFFPRLEETRFRNVIPVWELTVLNNSKTRYTVHYDLRVRKKGRTFFGAYDETTTAEKTLTSRPDSMASFPVMQGEANSTVVGVNVFKCSS